MLVICILQHIFQEEISAGSVRRLDFVAQAMLNLVDVVALQLHEGGNGLTREASIEEGEESVILLLQVGQLSPHASHDIIKVGI